MKTKLKSKSKTTPKAKPAPAVKPAPKPKQANIHEAKTHLSRLLKQVARGREVVIARNGKPIARLVPFDAPPAPSPQKRILGQYAGKIWMAPDFDDIPEGFEEYV